VRFELDVMAVGRGLEVDDALVVFAELPADVASTMLVVVNPDVALPEILTLLRSAANVLDAHIADAQEEIDALDRAFDLVDEEDE
jgi:hypothetical protein